ncbi:unnamed protein product [Diamesa hyperborea]
MLEKSSEIKVLRVLEVVTSVLNSLSIMTQKTAVMLIDPDEARQEKQATGKLIAVTIVVLVSILAIHKLVVKRAAVLAGVLVPAAILLLYTIYMIYSNKQEKRQRKNTVEASGNIEEIAKPEIKKKISNVSNASTLSVPSTSHMIRNELRISSKVNYNPTVRISADPKEINAIPMFKKAQSHSNILINHQTLNTNTTHVKKLRKSRSLEKMELKKSKQNKRNLN